jgi:hypothetical protein
MTGRTHESSHTWRIHPAWADRLAASLRRSGFEIVDMGRTA